MDKKTLQALSISFIILAVWWFLYPRLFPQLVPTPPGVAGATGSTGVSGPQGASSPEVKENAGPTAENDAIRPISPKREAPEGTPRTIVETGLARIEIESLGGTVRSWTLSRYSDYSKRPYELVSPAAAVAQTYPFQFRLEDKALEGLLNGRARFAVERGPVTVPSTSVTGHLRSDRDTTEPAAVPSGSPGSSDGATPASETHRETTPSNGSSKEQVRLVYSDGNGLEAVKTFVFTQDSYLVGFSASITRAGKAVPAGVIWGPGVGTPTPDDFANAHYEGGTAVLDEGAGVQRISGSTIGSPQKRQETLQWAGIEEQYFAVVFIPDDGMTAAEIVPTILAAPPPAPDAKTKAPSGPSKRLMMAVPTGDAYTLFAGPKDYQLLQGVDRNLSYLVNLYPSVPIIGPLIGVLAQILYAALRWLHTYIPNYGIGLILLTTAVKIIFYPITQRTMVKMRQVQQQMSKLKPKVDAIKNKYKKAKDLATRNKANEEIMELYRREGVNPMASLGGCLPLLIQLPILYGFYRVLTVSIELRQAPFFGWIQDLSRRDPYYVTPIVMGASMFLQQRLAMTNVTDPQQQMQQRMMLLMPIIFTWTFLSLPSGLVLYWFVNNLLGIAQQILINRQAKALDARAAEAASRA